MRCHKNKVHGLFQAAYLRAFTSTQCRRSLVTLVGIHDEKLKIFLFAYSLSLAKLLTQRQARALHRGGSAVSQNSPFPTRVYLRYAMLQFSTPCVFPGSDSVDRSLGSSSAGSNIFYWHILLVFFGGVFFGGAVVFELFPLYFAFFFSLFALFFFPIVSVCE